MAEPTKQKRNDVPVLDIENLAVAYKVRGGEIEAVQDVSFEIYRGESFGVVGESGCGKSTVAWSIVNFLGANGYVKRGNILFQGQDLVGRRRGATAFAWRPDRHGLPGSHAGPESVNAPGRSAGRSADGSSGYAQG